MIYRDPHGVEVDLQEIARLLSKYEEFSDFTVEDDDDGQLIINTGLYNIDKVEEG